MEENSQLKRTNSSFNKNKILRVMIIVVVLILVLVPSYYLYNQYQQTQELIKSPNQAQNLIDKVGQLIELPTNEMPKIATVSDVTRLSGQQFFADAKNGDKVLIYEKAGKAILYRPGINKIINVGPVNTVSNNPSPSPEVSTQSAKQQTTPKVLYQSPTTNP